MKSLPAVFVFSLLVIGCVNTSEAGRHKAIIGATLVNPDEPPVEPSIVIVRGSRVLNAGKQGDTPVPSGADKVDAAGKFVIPAPVHIPENARQRKIFKLHELRTLVDSGWKNIEGMVLDTEVLPTDLLNRLRDARHIMIPELVQWEGEPAKLQVALRNTRRMVDAQVLVACGSGPNAIREWRLLAKAGMTPAQVLRSTTRVAALVASTDAEYGALRPGYIGSLWILSADPLLDIENLTKVERRMTDGEWSR